MKYGIQVLLSLFALLLSCRTIGHTDDTFHGQVRAVLSRIQPPAFPSHTITIGPAEVTARGFRQAVNDAIEACHRQQGGKVVISPGEYQCNGPIRLLSNVNLHLSEGVVVRFGTDTEDYLPLVKVRWEGTVCYNYSPLIYAIGQRNIAITGSGVLDGQADKFWFAWKKQPDGDDQEVAKKLLRRMGETGVPDTQRIFGDGYRLRPTLIEFFECENILLEDFTARQSPFWTIHPVFSKNITIRGLTIRHGTTNDDGIDPDSCEDVLIEDCDIDTHDDAIAIKAGRDQDAWSRPATRHVVVRNCTLKTVVGNGVCIGSEMSGGVEGVWVDSCVVRNTGNATNIKANLDRGGYVRKVWIRNLAIDSCREAAIRIQLDYHGYRGGNFPPDFSQLTFENIGARSVGGPGWSLVGVPDKPIGTVVLKNVVISGRAQENRAEYADLVLAP